MNWPLTAHERVTIESVKLEGAQAPGLADFLAVTMFQVGQVLGGYPTARVHVVLDNADAKAFVMRLVLTIPREELGV